MEHSERFAPQKDCHDDECNILIKHLMSWWWMQHFDKTFDLALVLEQYRITISRCDMQRKWNWLHGTTCICIILYQRLQWIEFCDICRKEKTSFLEENVIFVRKLPNFSIVNCYIFFLLNWQIRGGADICVHVAKVMIIAMESQNYSAEWHENLV